MTSTTTFGGLNVEGRNSSKVLKPPGGGSSDIFGASSGGVEDTPTRRIKNHNASKLFLDDGHGHSGTPARSTGKDTHSRLFGPPPATPPPPPRARSNILNNGNLSTITPVTNGNNEICVTETDGGESIVDEPAPQTNGNAMPMPVVTNGNGNAAPRNRVPPGGYSSGLW